MKPVLSLIAATLMSCSALKPGCLIQDQGVQIVSSTIVSQLQCSNSAAVQSDILAAFDKLNLCPANQAKQGPLANLVCPSVTKYVASIISTGIVPAAWGCSGSNIQTALQSALLTACQQLPMAPKTHH